MKLKEMLMKLIMILKNFFTLDVRNHEGFTLVELIIVIAILAILSSVAVVGYSSYIKKANMQADRTMVSQLVSAIELASYMDEDAFPTNATLYLSMGDATVTGPDAAKLEAILRDAYGSNFKSLLKLKYNQWGLGGTVTTYAKSLISTLNGKELSYTDDVDALWEEVDAILIGLETTETMEKVYGGSAGLMASAAKFTLSGASSVTSQEDFAKMWADPSDTFTSYSDQDYTADAEKTSAVLDPMLTRYAAIKGRNYAFGNWLMGKSGMGAVAAEIQNASSGQAATGVGLPYDFISLITTTVWAQEGNHQSILTDLAAYVNEYFGYNYLSVTTASGGEYKYLTEGTSSYVANSQAYIDALGYYTLMQAVDSSGNDTKGMNNEEYRETMADAVHNVGAMLNADSATLDAIDGGCVAISVKRTANGEIAYYITPASIYVGGSNVQSGRDENSTEYVTGAIVIVDSVDGINFTFTAENALTLKVGTTGTIVLKAGQNLKAMAEAEGEDADAFVQSTFGGYLSSITTSDSSVAQVTGGSVKATGIGGPVTLTCSESEEVLFSITVTVTK